VSVAFKPKTLCLYNDIIALMSDGKKKVVETWLPLNVVWLQCDQDKSMIDLIAPEGRKITLTLSKTEYSQWYKVLIATLHQALKIQSREEGTNVLQSIDIDRGDTSCFL
jgi:hypothetical protein